MVNFYLEVLKDLINKGEISKNDAIINETKDRLIEIMNEAFPNHIDIAPYVDKKFEEMFEM